MTWLTGLAALLFATRTAAMKMITMELLPPQALLLQNGIALLCWLPFLRAAHLHWPRKTFPSHLLRAFAESSMLFIAYRLVVNMPTVHVTLPTLWGPLLFPFLLWAWQRSRISTTHWVGLAIGWAGLVVVCLPMVFGNMGLKALGVAAGLFGAIVLIANRSLRGRENPHAILFWAHLLPTLFFLPLALGSWVNPTWLIWLMVVIAGLTSLFIELILIKVAQASQPMPPWMYLAIFFSLLADWFIWGYLPTLIFIIGAAAAITGCSLILTAYRSSRTP